MNPSKLELLKRRRQILRKASFEAIDRGDKDALAKLTTEVAMLNETIRQAEGLVLK